MALSITEWDSVMVGKFGFGGDQHDPGPGNGIDEGSRLQRTLVRSVQQQPT